MDFVDCVEQWFGTKSSPQLRTMRREWALLAISTYIFGVGMFGVSMLFWLFNLIRESVAFEYLLILNIVMLVVAMVFSIAWVGIAAHCCWRFIRAALTKS